MEIRTINFDRQTWRANPKATRIFLCHAANFMMRTDYIRRLGAAGDIDRSSVLLTMFLRAIESETRDCAFTHQFGTLASSPNSPSLPPINAASFAAATGLPHETARRRLNELVDRELFVIRQSTQLNPLLKGPGDGNAALSRA